MKTISGKAMCRLLKARGWIHVRTNGSHYIFEHPDAERSVPVPVHGNRDLPMPMQRAIMRQTGLTDADL